MAMSSQPLSSIPVPPTFQKDGESAHFLRWMETRVAEITNPDLLRKDSRREWSSVVASLLPVLLIPGPDELRWEAMHEQVKLAEVSLLIIYHTSKCIPSLYAGEENLAQSLFAIIMVMGTTLDLWIDVDPPAQQGYLSPMELYEIACKAASAVLQALGDEVIPAVASKSRQLMKDLVTHCRGIVDGTLVATEFDFRRPHSYISQSCYSHLSLTRIRSC